MKRLFLFTLLAFTFMAATNEQVDDANARAILNKVSAKAKALKNMRFDFTYVMTDKKNKINDTLKGTITMSGDKFNLDFMGRHIVSDGKTVWTYDPDAEEIQINNVKEGEDAFNPGKLLTTFDKKYRSKLVKTIKEHGKYYYLIDLFPVKAKAYYKIRLKIDKAALRVVKGTIYNKDNVNYTYLVRKFQSNLKLPEGYFSFDVKQYPDAEVVDLR